jgi:Golgi nucleoside diphosphatase
MFDPQLPEKTNLDRAIDDLYQQMDDLTGDTQEYAQMADQLVKLHALKMNESSRRVSPDVKATILANLLGILIIVTHERVHVVTTKALGFIKKLG